MTELYKIKIELYKIKNELALPIMDSMLNRRNITYNFRNLQEFQSERKRTDYPKLPCTATIDNFARRK